VRQNKTRPASQIAVDIIYSTPTDIPQKYTQPININNKNNNGTHDA